MKIWDSREDGDMLENLQVGKRAGIQDEVSKETKLGSRSENVKLGFKVGVIADARPTSGSSKGMLGSSLALERGNLRGPSKPLLAVIERMGMVGESRLHQKLEEKNNEVWNLEDEIVKVFERGLALGLDFSGRKKEIS
ncbi:hypothetical protein Q3G72_019478 [Acer saccharum]|nr:hypothetical protein Q3G72_019478 [Acer saccharum]